MTCNVREVLIKLKLLFPTFCWPPFASSTSIVRFVFSNPENLAGARICAHVCCKLARENARVKRRDNCMRQQRFVYVLLCVTMETFLSQLIVAPVSRKLSATNHPRYRMSLAMLFENFASYRITYRALRIQKTHCFKDTLHI